MRGSITHPIKKLNVSQLSLIERIEDPNVTTIDPHEVARALRAFYEASNPDGVRQLRDAYLISLRKLRPFASAEKRKQIVDENLLHSAVVADDVSIRGHEASGQRLGAAIGFVVTGPITKFCKEAIGYKPSN